MKTINGCVSPYYLPIGDDVIIDDYSFEDYIFRFKIPKDAKNKKCIYRISIGVYMYIGCTKNIHKRIYAHYKSIKSRIRYNRSRFKNKTPNKRLLYCHNFIGDNISLGDVKIEIIDFADNIKQMFVLERKHIENHKSEYLLNQK